MATDHRPAWADDRMCSDCCGAFVCGMPRDDGSSWCQRAEDARDARLMIGHHVATLERLGAISDLRATVVRRAIEDA